MQAERAALIAAARPREDEVVRSRSASSVHRAYTLVEVLIVVTVLGIAGALVVPSFGQIGVLRVQGAVRLIVSDITVAQSDAIAFQRGQGIQFYADPTASRYVVAEVVNGAFDIELDKVRDQMIGGSEFGGVFIDNINLPNNRLIFDELGGPVTGPDSGVPANTGWIELAGPTQRYRITIEAYTGRVTVQTVEDEIVVGG